MKAVVLEIRKNEAAVLGKDGQVRKIRRQGICVGDTIELTDAELSADKTMLYRRIGRIGTAAAAAVLVLGLGGNYWYQTAMACSYVSLDINPSIEYTLNRQNRILDVTAVNDDAEGIVEQLKKDGIRKEYFSDAIAMTTELLKQNGYITEEETDYILINVASDDEKISEELKIQAENILEEWNAQRDHNIHVTMTESSVSERKKAKKLGISSGEYQEIKLISEEDDVSKYKDMELKELLEKAGQLKVSTSEDNKQKENSDVQTEEGRNTTERSEQKKEDVQKNEQQETESKQNAGLIEETESVQNMEIGKEAEQRQEMEDGQRENQEQNIKDRQEADEQENRKSDYGEQRTPEDQAAGGDIGEGNWENKEEYR